MSNENSERIPPQRMQFNMLHVFKNLADKLELKTEERVKLLNLSSADQLQRLNPNLDDDQWERLIHFFEIYDEAGRLIGDPAAWLKAANRNPVFEGKTPLQYLLEGDKENLKSVCQYLLSAYGGWA